MSFIIPAYNVSDYILDTLESLKNQTYSDFEIIIVDDSSTDNTKQIISSFIKKNDHLKIRLFESEKNRGVSATRNIGMRKASGEYIVFIDGDDFVDAQLVELVYKNREVENTELIVYGFNRITSDNKMLTNYFDKYNFPKENLAGHELLHKVADEKSIQMCVANIVYKRDFLFENSLEYTEECVSGEDTEFIYKAIVLANEVSFIPEVLFYYVIREGSITNSYNLKKFQTIEAVYRIHNFVLEYGNKIEKEIIRKNLNNMLIYRYTFNYNSCLSYLIENNYDKNNALDKLNKDIDRFYPTMRTSMVNLMKRYMGSNIKIFIKAKVFILSPLLYNKVF